MAIIDAKLLQQNRDIHLVYHDRELFWSGTVWQVLRWPCDPEKPEWFYFGTSESRAVAALTGAKEE